MPSHELTVGRVPAVVVMLDDAGRITHWDVEAERMFGWPGAEAIGRPAQLVIEADK